MSAAASPAEREARNARIRELKAAGKSYAEIARTLMLNVDTVDRVLNGPPPSRDPRPESDDTRRRKCLNCRKPFDATRFLFMCEYCRRHAS